MKDEEILARIQNVYNEVMGRTDVILKPGTRLVRSQGISSLVLMELIACLEDEFDVSLNYSTVRALKTVRGLIKVIKAQIQ